MSSEERVVVVGVGVVLVIVCDSVLFVMSVSAMRLTELTVALSAWSPLVAVHEFPFSPPVGGQRDRRTRRQ